MRGSLIPGITFALVLTTAHSWAWNAASAPENPPPLSMKSGWEYRWGDSPTDSKGTYTWLSDSSDEGWHTLPRLDWPPGRDDREWVWYKTRLPDVKWTQPALYLPSVVLSFEIYLEDELIYTHGIFEPDNRNKYTATETHVVPLPRDYMGKVLRIRIYSYIYSIGIEAANEGPLIGEQADVVRVIILGNAESSAVGFLFIFVGLFAVLTLIVRSRENTAVPLSFAFFALLLGIFYVLSGTAAAYIIRSAPLKLYAMAVSFAFFPVGMFAFIQATVFRRSDRASRTVIWVLLGVHVVTGITVLALDLLDFVPIPIGMRVNNLVFALSIPFAIYVTLRHALKGSVEARVVVWGFAIFAATGFHDLLQGLEVFPFWHWLSHWGALVFVGCLGYVLEREYTENHRRLKEYSSQLEEKSQQLEDYNRTLEEKVTERTRDLAEKNTQLEGTLDELKDTQHQLVIREKMASLGNLVAGVAHELNNPIGAVISSSDVSSRCISIIGKFVDKKAENEESKVRKASNILAENVRVVSEAAQRVSKIVKSLKDFSRLDEAELQKVNIHDGLESTLRLVHHLLKDRIEVVKEYGAVPELTVYPDQLNQVFMNIIVNAIDAIDGKGSITIRTHGDDLNVHICVEDTGRGILADNVAHVFDPGFTTKGVGVGTGLGLSISYNIIQKHHGALNVQSEPSRGTTFTIVLPVRQMIS